LGSNTKPFFASASLTTCGSMPWGERFQEAFAMLRTASEQRFPSGNFHRYGEFQGHLDVIPKPFASRFPSLVVGRSRQEIE
jgi:hypothetical protein